jgi:GNAT superfamily N-acetyltransferase
MTVTIRRASAADFPGVLELTRRALGWTDDDTRFLEWKHLRSPFGPSPMWVAIDDDRIVGFRAFLRWEFVTRGGRTVTAGRAVDTATDPSRQGQGIFTRLTTEALAALPGDGVELIFNTPNGKSLPGYLKMGWHEVGRLAVAVMPTSARFPVVVATARQPAGRWPIATGAGEAPADVFGAAAAAGDGGVDELLACQPVARGLSTRRSREFLAWRYGDDELGYRVVLVEPGRPAAGVAVFRLRRRGRAVEGVLCDVLTPGGDEPTARRLVRQVARIAGADYLIRLDRRTVTRDRFVRLPRVGPVLACRPLTTSPAPELSEWALTMGDVELF